ncbi:MAG: alpha/beta fold hydrolase [Actinomycetota bacterium]|nr:alpha/beta fold hydrolase [Actinomycetota bacterium]
MATSTTTEPAIRPEDFGGGPGDRHSVKIHGHKVCFRLTGSGPLIVLIHGITGSSAQWIPVMDVLRDRYTLFAPDLLGHGESAKPRGDYSLGAYASGIRDLLIGLDAERATVVGHSLGGGIAMQMAYQYPERCGRLVLMSSGGIGQEVHPLLRAASLPGSEIVLPLITHARLLGAGAALSRALGAIGLQTGADIAEGARGYASLNDREARAAFVHTIRAVIDPTGQRVSALDRLYLAEALPSLIVWGENDRIIPSHHAEIAHDAMPESRLELIEGAGHFPQMTDPIRVARLLADFIDETEPAEIEAEDMRELVISRMAADGG